MKEKETKFFLNEKELSSSVINKAQLSKIIGGSYAESTKVNKPRVEKKW